MAGVDVRVTTIGGPSPTAQLRATQLFLVGQAERGPTDEVVKIGSVGAFVERFGDRVPYGWLFDVVDTFFREGGQVAQIARVVGAGATLGDVELSDRQDIAEPTVLLEALGAGSWSSDVTVSVTDGAIPDTVNIAVTYGSTTEAFRNLSSVADIVAEINARSRLVTATDLGSAGVGVAALPAVGDSSLTAGDDDRASIVADDYTAALDLFGPALGIGVVSIPGQEPLTIIDAVRDHVSSTDRLALLAAPQGSDFAEAQGTVPGLRADSEADAHIGMIWPWVEVPVSSGRTRTVPPEGFVAGRRAATIVEQGVGQPPAGSANGAAEHVVATETYVDKDTATDANDAGVIPLRTLSGTPTVYGWRSISANLESWQWLQWRDLVNLISEDARLDIEEFVFRTIDAEGNLISEVHSALQAIGERYRDSLFARYDEETGDQLDPGYLVNTGTDLNPVDQLAAGQIRGQLSVRPSPAGELITIDVAKAAVTAAL